MLRKQAVSMLLILILLCSIGNAYAEQPATVLASIGNRTQGESFTVRGTTSLPEVIVQILRPNQTMLEMDQLTKDQLQSGKLVTLPAEAPVGVYTVKAGAGSSVAVTTFEVLAKGDGGEPEPQPFLDLTAIGSVEAGGTLLVKGTTNQPSVTWKLFSPDGTLLTAQTLTMEELKSGYAYTIPAAAASGVYTLWAGNEKVSRQISFQVTRKDSEVPGGGNPSGGHHNRTGSGNPGPVNSPPVVPSEPKPQPDGSVVLELQPQGQPDAAGTAKVVVTQEAIDQALALLHGGAAPKLRLHVSKAEGAQAYELTLPATVITDNGKDLLLELQTETAIVTIRGDMFRKNQTEGVAAISFVIGRVNTDALSGKVKASVGSRPVIDLHVLLEGKEVSWSNREAPVIVSIPYQPSAAELADPEGITVWFIDGAGNPSPVPSGKYDGASGSVTFRTAHFSQYAVVHITKTFADLTDYSWAEKPIKALAAKGIITGTSEEAFTPAAPIKRADFVLLLVRTLELSAAFDQDQGFDDVKPGDYFYEALGIARALGISDGAGNNQFLPDKEISRQEMTTLTARAMRVAGMLAAESDIGVDKGALKAFKDGTEVADYAAASMAALIKKGIIEGSDGSLHPLDSTSRAETAVMLYRIYNLIGGM